MSKRLSLMFLIFLLLQIPLLFVVLPSDENVYYAVAREVSNGGELYSEIFFGHPPLQIWIYTRLIKLFGFHIVLLKVFTLLVSVGCIGFVYLIAKERYGENHALLSVFLFMTSYDIMIFSSFAFGLEIAVLFFLASLYYLNKNNYVSGLFYALCIMTRFHLGVLGLILFLYCKEKKKFIFGASPSLVYYGCLISIPNFLSNVFGYHLIKPHMMNGWVAYFRANIHLLILLAFSFRWIKDVKLVFIGVTYCLFMLLVNSVFEYYFLLVTIILCVEGAGCLFKSKYRKALLFMACFWFGMLLFKSAPFLINNTQGYNEFVDYVDTLEDKPLVGQSAITSMLALRTYRDISKSQIDTNSQRKQAYNYSDAIVVYEEGRFKGYDFNCSFLNVVDIEGNVYEVWECPK